MVFFFNENLSFEYLIIVQTFSAIAILIPISIGALGILEGTIAGLLAFFGLTKASAAGIALIYRSVLIVFALVGLVVMLVKDDKYNLKELSFLKPKK